MRWITSHHLVACSYWINLTGIIHIFVHVWARWLKVIIVVIVQRSLSSLLGWESGLLFEKLVIGSAHFVPILSC